MRHQAGLLVCGALVVGAMLVGCTPRTAMSEAEAQAIRDTVISLDSAMSHAVDSLDCQKGLSYIGDQAPLFVSGGHVVRTHAQLQNMCEKMVAARTGAVLVTDTVTAHAISPDAAYVVREGEYTIRYRDGRVVVAHMVGTTIWQREGGRWRMVHLHESGYPLPDSTAAKASAR